MRRLCLLVGVAVLSLLLVACSSSDFGPEVDAVQAYALALPEALAAREMDPIEAVATPEQAERVRMYVLGILGEGQRIDAVLKQQEVLSSEAVDLQQANVLTRESWVLNYLDLETGEIVSTESYEADIEYTVVLTDVGWMISDVTELAVR